jgi:hypothetical protein
MEPLVHMLIILARKDARCDEVSSLQARAAALAPSHTCSFFARVLKLAGVFENLMCPLFLVLAIKSPALHVLRFNHKRTVHRHSYMVDMSGTLTEARSCY